MMKTKHSLLLIILLFTLLITVACQNTPQIGGTIKFGKYRWLVLDIKDDQMLIISEKMVALGAYHQSDYVDGAYTNDDPILWSECNLRKYLNTDFYDTFSDNEKARIVETTIITPNNPWYGTDGGSETIDKVFLLSLEEVVHYFGDSGDLQNRKVWTIDRDNSDLINRKIIYLPVESVEDGFFINDQYNDARIAKNGIGTKSMWWLRSPGRHHKRIATIEENGVIFVSGTGVTFELGGCRPAMWVKLQ